MSAIASNAVFELAKARSDLIDAHNTADLAVRRKLQRFGVAANHLLGQSIEALAKVPAGPQYAKQEKARIHALLDELRDLHSVRCDLVHSRMQTLSVDGLTHGFFSNVQKVTKHGRSGTLLSSAEMNMCADSLTRIARELES